MKTKEFLSKLFKIAIPIMIANLFTNLASLIDTMMVGNLNGTALSGVYIATQIIFVINLALFGSVEGASVYFSQFFGKKDYKHLRNTFAFKVIASCLVAVISIIVVNVFGESLASLFTKSSEEVEVAVNYMRLVSISFIPFAIKTSFETSLREAHHPTISTIITAVGVVVNILFNYLFIFGIWIFPELGSNGAAIGTIIDRVVELVLIIIVCNVLKCNFCKHFIKSLKIESNLLKNLIIKSLPLMFNEIFWSLGQTGLVYVFTQKDAIATNVLPIVSTIFNLVLVVTMGLGNAVAIIEGNIIGEGNLKEAQNKAWISLIATAIITAVVGGLLALSSPLILMAYPSVTQDVKQIAQIILYFDSGYLIITSVNCVIFFLLRAGGRTFIVFFFDSLFAIVITIPWAFLLLKCFPQLSFTQLVILAYLIEVAKTVFGIILIMSKKWHKNIVSQYETSTSEQ